MKKLFKPFALLGAVLVVIGTGISIAAVRFGATWWFPNSFGYTNNSEQRLLSEDTVTVTGSIEIINIETNICAISILPGPDFSVNYSGTDAIDISYEMTGNSIYIYEDRSNSFMFENATFTSAPIITLTVPENYTFNGVYIYSDIGNVDILSLNTNTLSVDSSIGNITLENVSANEMFLSNEIGNTIINDSTVKYINYDGDIGEFELNIIGDINDYQIYADNDIGNIYVNSTRFSTYSVYNEATKEGYILNLYSNVGDIIVNIYE